MEDDLVCMTLVEIGEAVFVIVRKSRGQYKNSGVGGRNLE